MNTCNDELLIKCLTDFVKALIFAGRMVSLLGDVVIQVTPANSSLLKLICLPVWLMLCRHFTRTIFIIF